MHSGLECCTRDRSAALEAGKAQMFDSKADRSRTECCTGVARLSLAGFSGRSSQLQREKAACGGLFAGKDFFLSPYYQNSIPGRVHCQRFRAGSSLFSAGCSFVTLDNRIWEMGGRNLRDLEHPALSPVCLSGRVFVVTWGRSIVHSYGFLQRPFGVQLWTTVVAGFED